MLRDAEAEVLFCFSLEESLKRAQVAPLFKVCSINGISILGAFQPIFSALRPQVL